MPDVQALADLCSHVIQDHSQLLEQGDKQTEKVVQLLASKHLNTSILSVIDHKNWIKSLNFKASNITDEGLARISVIQGLTSLNIAECPHITDNGIMKFKGHLGLCSLDLSKTKVSDDGVQTLSFCSSLEVLDLSYTQIGDDALQNFGGHKRLHSLILRNTRVSGELFSRWLSTNTPAALHTLVLPFTRVGDDSAKAIAAIPSLGLVDLKSTKYTQSGLLALQDMLRRNRKVPVKLQPGNKLELPSVARSSFVYDTNTFPWLSEAIRSFALLQGAYAQAQKRIVSPTSVTTSRHSLYGSFSSLRLSSSTFVDVPSSSQAAKQEANDAHAESENSPIVETPPIAETTPSVEVAPIAETTPIVETAPSVETVPIVETAPSVDIAEVATIVEMPAPELLPTLIVKPTALKKSVYDFSSDEDEDEDEEPAPKPKSTKIQPPIKSAPLKQAPTAAADTREPKRQPAKRAAVRKPILAEIINIPEEVPKPKALNKRILKENFSDNKENEPLPSTPGKRKSPRLQSKPAPKARKIETATKEPKAITKRKAATPKSSNKRTKHGHLPELTTSPYPTRSSTNAYYNTRSSRVLLHDVVIPIERISKKQKKRSLNVPTPLSHPPKFQPLFVDLDISASSAEDTSMDLAQSIDPFAATYILDDVMVYPQPSDMDISKTGNTSLENTSSDKLNSLSNCDLSIIGTFADVNLHTSTDNIPSTGSAHSTHSSDPSTHSSTTPSTETSPTPSTPSTSFEPSINASSSVVPSTPSPCSSPLRPSPPASPVPTAPPTHTKPHANPDCSIVLASFSSNTSSNTSSESLSTPTKPKKTPTPSTPTHSSAPHTPSTSPCTSPPTCPATLPRAKPVPALFRPATSANLFLHRGSLSPSRLNQQVLRNLSALPATPRTCSTPSTPTTTTSRSTPRTPSTPSTPSTHSTPSPRTPTGIIRPTKVLTSAERRRNQQLNHEFLRMRKLLLY